MSDLEILENVVNTLNNIQIPAALTKAVAVPIYNSLMDLQALHDAIVKRINATQAKKAPEEHEAKIEEPQPVECDNTEPVELFQEDQ